MFDVWFLSQLLACIEDLKPDLTSGPRAIHGDVRPDIPNVSGCLKRQLETLHALYREGPLPRVRATQELVAVDPFTSTERFVASCDLLSQFFFPDRKDLVPFVHQQKCFADDLTRRALYRPL